MTFSPKPGDLLQIDRHTYHFLRHPAAPKLDTPFHMTGRFGTVYALEREDGEQQALKVFLANLRDPRFVDIMPGLRKYSGLPALRVCEREVLTPSVHADLLRRYPELEYAVLMPWLPGETWSQIILKRTPMSASESHALAAALASSLAGMEFWQLAHCDLSNGNVMVTINPPSLGLVDVEGLYAPGLPKPVALAGGSPGYAHHTSPRGIWSAEADRFAGAILLAEMLGWCDAGIREEADSETYFDPNEMPSQSALHRTCPRLSLLEASLQRNWGSPIAEAFSAAWRSTTLSECPRMSDWAKLIESASPPRTTFVSPSSPRPAENWNAPARAPASTSGGGGAWKWWVAIGLVLLVLIAVALSGGRHG